MFFNVSPHFLTRISSPDKTKVFFVHFCQKNIFHYSVVPFSRINILFILFESFQHFQVWLFISVGSHFMMICSFLVVMARGAYLNHSHRQNVNYIAKKDGNSYIYEIFLFPTAKNLGWLLLSEGEHKIWKSKTWKCAPWYIFVLAFWRLSSNFIHSFHVFEI